MHVREKRKKRKMTFSFYSLNSEEKEIVYNIEDRFPECVIQDVIASFDGSTALQLITPENLAVASELFQCILQTIAVIVSASIAAEASKCVAKINSDATRDAAKIGADATRDAANISADATRDAAKNNAATRDASKENAGDNRNAAKTNTDTAGDVERFSTGTVNKGQQDIQDMEQTKMIITRIEVTLDDGRKIAVSSMEDLEKLQCSLKN